MTTLKPIRQYYICNKICKYKISGNITIKTPNKSRGRKLFAIVKRQNVDSFKRMCKMAGKLFKIDDLVFAKVKGYAPWPAKITKMNIKKYHVTFFGTGETAWVNEDNVFSYVEYKKKFVTEKLMEHDNFCTAINEIESILNAKDLPRTNSSNIEEVKSTTTTASADAKKQNVEVIDLIENNDQDAGSDELPSTSTANRPVVSNLKKTEGKSKSVRRLPVIIINNLLLVYMPSAKCLGIDINYKKPESFGSAAEEVEWMEKSRDKAYELKLKLEAGQLKPNCFGDRIVDEPMRYEMPKEEAIRFVKDVINEENALAMELQFIKLTQKLRDSLGLRNANVHKCLDTLKQFKKINFTKLMLLRNPECVDVMRRVQRYISDSPKAEIIRKESSEIYNMYKKVFMGAKPRQGYFFWNDLCEKIKVYKKYTQTSNFPFRIILNENPGYNLDVPHTM